MSLDQLVFLIHNIYFIPIFAARPVPDEGVTGILHVANPLDACAPLKNHIPEGEPLVPFVVISRGTCNFDKKVKNAQVAGFQAAIVYNTMDFTDEMITSKTSGRIIWMSVCWL